MRAAQVAAAAAGFALLAGLADVLSGNNTVSFPQGGKLHTVTGFRAGRGYDLASGVGTVNAPRFVPELAAAASHPSWTWTQVAAQADGAQAAGRAR